MRSRRIHILIAVTFVAALSAVSQQPASATPTCMGKKATITDTTGPIVGTEGDDVIVGTDDDDVIEGLDGQDLICAGDGWDDVNAGLGNDRIDAGPGDDHVDGDATDGDPRNGPRENKPQDDVIIGGPGSDDLFGGGGADVIKGGDDGDVLYGDYIHIKACGDFKLCDFYRKFRPSGPDRLDGGGGDDILYGFEGADRLVGGSGNDTLDGDEGGDRIDGGLGDDIIDGGAGRDKADGGPGIDECRDVESVAGCGSEAEEEVPPGTPVHFSATITNETYFENYSQYGATLIDLQPNSVILKGQTWTFTNNTSRKHLVMVRVLGPNAKCGGRGFVLDEYVSVMVEPGETTTKEKNMRIGGYKAVGGEEMDDYCVVIMRYSKGTLEDGESITVEADLLKV